MERLLKLIEEQKTLIMQYLFALVLVTFLCVLVIHALWHNDLRSLWVAAGLSAMVLMLLSKEKGASLFLAVMLIGTLVAREEFILDAAAIIKGEKLQEVRESRIGTISYGDQEISIAAIRKEIEAVLTRRGTEDPAELASKVIDAAEVSRIDTDKGNLNDAAKAIINMLAKEGPTSDTLEETRWDKYLTKGLDSVEGSQQLLSLGYMTVDDMSCVRLTSRGIRLSEALGLKPVDQDSSCN